uniref:Uncharacterized protein n=1 Tax=Rhodnius prolixus TaxID=13249 RepID=T1I4T5_RHOPR
MDSSDSCLENTPPSIKETAENVISNVNTQFTDVFQLEQFILTLFKPFESTFISHISTYLDVIAYLYIFD